MRCNEPIGCGWRHRCTRKAGHPGDHRNGVYGCSHAQAGEALGVGKIANPNGTYPSNPHYPSPYTEEDSR